MTQTTLYVVAYDIEDDRRRTRVHKLLSGYGQWTQFSLFECYLTRLQRTELRHALDQILDAAKDQLRFYPLCAACEARVETVGRPPPAEPTLYLL